MICEEPDLAELDLELADVWARALPRFPASELDRIRAFQRGWIKGRNDCWKAEVVAACVRAEYERRITALEIEGGLVEAPDVVRLDCDSGPIMWVASYTDTKLPVVVLTSQDEQVLAFEVATDRGSRYEGPDVVYHERDGEVVLQWRGIHTSCRPIPRTSATSSPCVSVPLDASFVIATSPAAGAVVATPFEAVGCSRTFESTVVWRLLARDGSVVAEGVASGGGVSGPATFRFTVEADSTLSGLHHLEVEEPRVTDEGYPPGRTVVPLILRPHGAGANE